MGGHVLYQHLPSTQPALGAQRWLSAVFTVSLRRVAARLQDGPGGQRLPSWASRTIWGKDRSGQGFLSDLLASVRSRVSHVPAARGLAVHKERAEIGEILVQVMNHWCRKCS